MTPASSAPQSPEGHCLRVPSCGAVSRQKAEGLPYLVPARALQGFIAHFEGSAGILSSEGIYPNKRQSVYYEKKIAVTP